MRKLSWIALALTAVTASLPSQAAVFGYYLSNATGSPAAAITASGNTPVQLTNLTAADLVGINVLWILNGDNSGPDGNVTGNTAAINAFVAGGGVLSFHDRAVTNAATYIPGAAAVTFVRDFTNDADIDIVTNNTVTNGPGGVLNNTSLDGGTSSSHGYADVSSLPPGGVEVLSRGGEPARAVDFYFGLGAGDVYYSTIPLDFYLDGNGPNPPRDNFRNVYAVNEAAFQAQLFGANGTPVPEPGSLALVAVAGLMLLSQARRATSARG